MNFFKWFKRPTQKINLAEIRKQIHDGFINNAPCTRAHLPLFVAAMSDGAKAFVFYHNWRERLVKLIDKYHGKIDEVEIPLKSYSYKEDLYENVEKALKKAIKDYNMENYI